MNENDNELTPGLDDDDSVPFEERVSRYAAYLRDRTDHELAIQIAAYYAIVAKKFKHAAEVLEAQFAPLEDVKTSVDTLLLENHHLEIAARQLALDEYEVRSAVLSRKNQLVASGSKGGKTRSEKLNPLREWAISENEKMLRGNPTDRARRLMVKIPGKLAELSSDPERFIRDVIKSHMKKT